MILRPQTALAGGRYIVQHHLDSGAMADVYLATDTQRAVSVALKVMRAELSLDEYFETYFQREASVLQQLQHPNIVRLYELVRDGNLLFLVMDYITGPTLQQHLFTKKLLPTSDAILIARSLATALDFAHSKGVIHRDLKPSNVLLADHGAILLSDFGVARVAGSVTTAASRMGTLAYMSPEQITGGELTPAADQYSLGILLWELLTGRRPFVGETPGLAAGPLGERVMEEHLKYPPPTGVLPADMFPVLVRTLAKHARQRFPTCLDMVNQLITNTGVQPTSAKLWNRKIDNFDAAPTQPPPIALPKPGIGVIATPAAADVVKRFTVAPLSEAPAKLRKRDPILPSFELLDHSVPQQVSEAEINRKTAIIEKTLREFDVQATVIDYLSGPTVTQFAVQPGFVEKAGPDGVVRRQKVRIAQISGLANDLALTLAAGSLRIQAPVPGQSYVGIEVPNQQKSFVNLRGVMESVAFNRIESPLKIALGRDVSGAAVAADLGAMPHLLIAGTTGAGKSVCIAALITGLVMNNSPEDLRLVLVDPKRVELIRFNGLPHLLGRVEVELERIVGTLRWIVREMERRYKKFEEHRVRDLDGHNHKVKRRKEEYLPRIVVVIDDLADLMMLAQDEVERNLARLAQMARATGIHLVVATQRPSTDILTGLTKANFPARISFSVASAVDSRVVLDSVGAEALLGQGDMLFLSPDAPAPVRVQGVYVSDAELEKVVEHWVTQSAEQAPAAVIKPAIETEAPVNPAAGPEAPWDALLLQQASVADKDDLIAQAIAVVKEARAASASLLQRKLKLGYSRAERLMDELEEMGIIGREQSDGKTREVLLLDDDAAAGGVYTLQGGSDVHKPNLHLDAAPRSASQNLTQPSIAETKDAGANDVRTRRFVKTRRYGDSSYTGEFKDDKRNGQGTLTFPDGETYSGTWKDDKYNGQGTLTFADGNTYTGEFRDGKYNGQGTLTFADGTTYTGEFKDDKRNGSGTFTYADGRKSTGEFLDGMPKDHRTYTYADAGVIAAPVKSDVHKTNLHLDAAQRSASQNLTQQNSGETKDAGASGVRTTRFVQAKRYGDSSYTGEFREGNPTGQGTVLTPKVVEIPTPEKSGADKTVKLDDRPKIDRATARQAWHDAVKKEGVHRATIREIEMQITAHKNKVHFKCRAVYLNNQALDRGNVEVGNELLRYYGWSGGINVELGLIKSFTSGSSNLSPRSGVPLLQRLHPKVIRQGDTLLITVRQFHTKPKQVVLADLPNGSKLQQEIEVRIEKLAEAKHQLTELELQKTAAKATLAEATLNQERAFRFLTTGKD